MTELTPSFAELETDADAISRFVTSENERTHAAYMGAAFEKEVGRAAAMLENPDRLGGLTRRGSWYYTFKQTAQNPRGLWLRRTISKPIEAREGWDTVFDVDAFLRGNRGRLALARGNDRAL